METLFENQYTMSKNRYFEWAKRPIKKNAFVYMWLGIMVFTLSMSIFSIINNDIIYFAFYMLLTVFCIYRCFFRAKMLLSKQFKAIAISQGKEEWERVIQIAGSIIITDGNTKTEYQWNQVNELINDKDYIILVFQKGMGIRLDKNGFKKGTTDSFLDFVKKEYQSIPLTTRK